MRPLVLMIYGFVFVCPAPINYSNGSAFDKLCPVCVDESAIAASRAFLDLQGVPLVEFGYFWPPCNDSRIWEESFLDSTGCLRLLFFASENKFENSNAGIIQLPYVYFKRIFDSHFAISRSFILQSGNVTMIGELCDKGDVCFADHEEQNLPEVNTTSILLTTTSSNNFAFLGENATDSDDLYKNDLSDSNSTFWFDFSDIFVEEGDEPLNKTETIDENSFLSRNYLLISVIAACVALIGVSIGLIVLWKMSCANEDNSLMRKPSRMPALSILDLHYFPEEISYDPNGPKNFEDINPYFLAPIIRDPIAPD